MIARVAYFTVSTIALASLFFAPRPGAQNDWPKEQAVNVARQECESYNDVQLLADFQDRVQGYVTLHRRLEGPLPPLALSSDPREIFAAIDALKQELRAARFKAKQGDIFTRDIARLFRNTIHETLCDSDLVELLAVFAEENDKPTAPPRVNASYPVGSALPMMSPRLLLALPLLPEELQYRFMHRSLILWDVHAELIVDFIPDAIPLNEGERENEF
jgi:hypothetical protein